MTPIRERTQEIMADESRLDAVLAEGAARAGKVAAQTMDAVRDRVGFVRRGF